MSEKWWKRWVKINHTFKKIYSMVPLRDNLFKYRCWFFYTLMIFQALIFVPLILLTVTAGTQINLYSQYKIIFPLSLFFFYWIKHWYLI